MFSKIMRVILLGVTSLFIFTATGCNERLKRMESNQVVLEEKIDHNSRQVLLLAKKMEMSQAVMEGRIERVQEGNNVALAEARATRYEQEKLREETRQFGQKWYAGITRVEEHQRLLQDSVNGVAGTTVVIDQGVQKLDAGQETSRQLMAANQAQTLAGFDQVKQGQGDLRQAATQAFSDLNKGQTAILAMSSEGVSATGRVANQVANVQKSQAAQAGVMQEYHTVLVAKVDDVASDQQKLQRLTNRQAKRISDQVTTVQTDLQKANAEQSSLIAQRADTIDADLKTSLNNQAGLSDQIKGHQEFAMDMGEHVKSIEAEQKRMNDAMQQGNKSVDSAVKAVEQDQKKLHSTLINVEATAVATNKQATSIADKQAEFHKLEDQRHDIVIQAMDGLGASQDKTQDMVTQIQKQSQGIAGDTRAIRDQQAQLDQGLNKEASQIIQGLGQLEKNQGQLQQDVGRVQATSNTIQSTTNAVKDNTEETVKITRSMRDQQGLLQRNLAQEGTQIHWELAQLEKNQGQLQQSVNQVQSTTNAIQHGADETGKVAQSIRDQQASFQQSLTEEGAQIRQALVQVGKNQDQIHRAVNNVQVTTNTVASNTTTLMEQQATLQRAIHQNQEQLVGSHDQLGANQKGLSQQAGALQQGQGEIKQLIGQSQNAVGTKVDAVSNQQGALKGTVEGVMAVTQAVAQDTRDLKQGQGSLKTTVQSGNADISQQVGQITSTQSSLNQMIRVGKGDLDTQILALQQNQTATRQAMDQKQQAWENQAQDMVKRVSTLETSLLEVNQNVSSLQSNLVSQITELTKVMKALQEQDGVQKARLTEDVKAFSETLRQIQATQSMLAKRIEQVDASQKIRSKEFLTALEQLRKQADKTPPAVTETEPNVGLVK